MIRLSKSFIDKIELPEKQTFYRDSALIGFGLRVSSGGTKSFIVERRVNGKVKRRTIGNYGTITPEQARKMAYEQLNKMVHDVDPIEENKQQQVEKITLEKALDDYIQTRKDLKPSTIKDYNKCLNCYLSDWKQKRLLDITKDMVEDRHREIGQRTESKANATMRVLRAIFNHSINKYEDSRGEPLIKVNPVSRLSQNRAWYPDKRKTTLLKSHELKPWYNAVMQLNQEVTRDYLLFLLFTGLRRSEASSLTWKDIDFKDRTFTVLETKNKDPHTMPMSDFLMDLLMRRSSYGESEWVFPSPLTDGPLKEPRTAISRVVELCGISFTCHDLRRTFITIAESLDIPAYALKKLMNHRDPNDVTAGYIISNVDRLRKPMEKISERIINQTQGVES